MAYFIVNRRARRLRNDGPLLREQCRDRATIEVIETRDLDELSRAAAHISKSPGPVILAGGDGSHGAGITALWRAFGGRELPPIALAPGGTVNTVARGWGMHGDAVAYTRRLVAAVEAGTAAPTRRPTLVIDHEKIDGLKDVPASSRLGFIFGAGLVSRFFEIYDAHGSSGLASAASITARVFAGSFVGGSLARRVLTPASCTLVVDGEPAPFDRLSLLCASVVEDLGLGLRLTYRAAEAHDRFHVVATPLEPRVLGPQMPRVLSGLPLRGPRVDALAASLSLRFPDGAGAYVVDGELVRSDSVRVSAGPCITMLEP